MEYVWALALGFVIALVLAFGIGANDVANSFGTSVGSKVLTLVQACIIATIFETLGAVLIGAQVSDTIRKGIIDVNIYNGTEHLLVSGEISALMGSAIWLILATFLKLPVSASHSIVGSTLGFSLVAKGHHGIHWEKLGYIVSSWFASPLLSGVISGSIFLLIRKYVLNQEKSLKAGLKVLPFIYASTLAVNLFSIFYNGPRVLKFDKIPVYGAFILTIGISLIIGICVRLFLIPWYRKRIIENNVASVNLLKSGATTAAGGKKGEKAAQLPASCESCDLESRAAKAHHQLDAVRLPTHRHNIDIATEIEKQERVRPRSSWLASLFRALAGLWRPGRTNDSSAQSSLRPLSASSMSTLTTTLSITDAKAQTAPTNGSDHAPTKPAPTPRAMNGPGRALNLHNAPALIPKIVGPPNSPGQGAAVPTSTLNGSVQAAKHHVIDDVCDEDFDHLNPHHRERKLSDSDRLFLNYIMPGQIAHFEESHHIEHQAPGGEEVGGGCNDLAAKVGSAYGPNGLNDVPEDDETFEATNLPEAFSLKATTPVDALSRLGPSPLKMESQRPPPTERHEFPDDKVAAMLDRELAQVLPALHHQQQPQRNGSLGKRRRRSRSKSLDSAPGPCQHSKDPPGVSRLFSFLQILTGAFGAFAHGGNDVSNSIGPLIALYEVCKHGGMGKMVEPPLWILLFGGAGISLGLWIFGKPVMETMGKDLTVITPTSGFTIEIGAALTVLLASNLGIPISTTHCKVGSIVFVGYLRSKQSVDWKLFGNIVAAWIVTVPVSMALSASLMAGLRYAVK